MNPAAKLSTLRFYGIVKKRSNPEYIRVPLYELYKTPDIDILANQEQTLNRLIVVVEAIFPENDSDAELPLHVPSFKRNIYWRQAFYLSSGSSSGLLYSWLPFNGVGVYFGKMWFIKPIMEFSSPDYSKFPQEAIEDECVKKELSDDFKIPEYPLIKRDKQNREFSSRVIRKSFLLASQDFGSFMFIDQNSMDLIIKNLGERESDEDKLMIINRIERFTNKHIPALTKERDDVPEVEGMSTLEYYNLAAKEALGTSCHNYRDRNPHEVNALEKWSTLIESSKKDPLTTVNQYIGDLRATPIDNVFRNTDLASLVPKIYDVGADIKFIVENSKPEKTATINLPHREDVVSLSTEVKFCGAALKCGKIDEEEVKRRLVNFMSDIKSTIDHVTTIYVHDSELAQLTGGGNRNVNGRKNTMKRKNRKRTVITQSKIRLHPKQRPE